MENVIIALIVAQLLSTAYGLAVIGSVKPIIEKKLEDQGYVLKNKNSMYKFNEGLGNFFKGFIPFYYALKAISLVQGKDPIDRAVKNEIENGEYITREERQAIKEKEEFLKTASLAKPMEPQIVFEKPEKYVARKNDYTLYDSYETPIEYITRETTTDETLDITPYMAKEVEKPKYIEKEVTKSDIAKAIAELDAFELETLGEKIESLAAVKKRNKTLRLKDVA